MAVSFLEKRRYAAMKPESASSRAKVLMLTPSGQIIRDLYSELIVAIEKRWQVRFGEGAVATLCEALGGLGAGASAEKSRLLEGLKPYTDGWRAAVPKPETLPHYPMVLHRGGFPDGS